jgi:3-hydroxyisobutyrate dehydrogenase-like beta-hydroxyacid dehydrogenase
MTHPRGASPVTVLGLGAMGTALAHAFLDAGHRTTVWNRTARRADDLVARGAVRAKTVAEGLAASPVTVICVLDHAVVRELLDPIPDQLAGRAVVNLTSSTPRQARETADWADRRHLDYLAGSIMVPTPLIGRPEALLLYSGTEEMYQTHHATLANLGGQSEFLGTDAGLASLYELGMVDLFFASMAGFLHAVAMVGSDGVSARRFLPYAEQIVAILPETLNGLAHDVDAKTYPGNEDNLTMNVAGIDHIVQASQEFGIHTGLPEVIRALARRAIARGHGGDGFSRLIEEFRQPA